MKYLAAVCLLLLLYAGADAATLVMVDSRSCVYCAKFNREVAPTYPTTQAGKLAPLRRVDVRRWPADLQRIRRAPYTPVFILVDKGREVGRFAGYTKPSRFWASLNPLLKIVR